MSYKKYEIHYELNGVSEQKNVVNNKFTVGSDLNCDLVINDESIQEEHFRIDFDEDEICLIDFGSVIGTLLNGQKVKNNEPIRLKLNDLIELNTTSDFKLKFAINLSYDEEINDKFKEVETIVSDSSINNNLEDSLKETDDSSLLSNFSFYIKNITVNKKRTLKEIDLAMEKARAKAKLYKAKMIKEAEEEIAVKYQEAQSKLENLDQLNESKLDYISVTKPDINQDQLVDLGTEDSSIKQSLASEETRGVEESSSFLSDFSFYIKNLSVNKKRTLKEIDLAMEKARAKAKLYKENMIKEAEEAIALQFQEANSELVILDQSRKDKKEKLSKIEIEIDQTNVVIKNLREKKDQAQEDFLEAEKKLLAQVDENQERVRLSKLTAEKNILESEEEAEKIVKDAESYSEKLRTSVRDEVEQSRSLFAKEKAEVLSVANDNAKFIIEEARAREKDLKQKNIADLKNLENKTYEELEVLKEKANIYSRKARSEVNDFVEKLRSDAENQAKITIEKADLYSKNLRREADTYSEKVRKDTNDNAQKNRQEADEYVIKARSEADAYCEKVKTEADEYSVLKHNEAKEHYQNLSNDAQLKAKDLVLDAETRSKNIIAEADTYSEKIRKDTNDNAQKNRQEADEYVSKVRSEADFYCDKIKTEAEEYENKIHGDADVYFNKIKTEADEYANEIRDKAEVYCEKIKIEANEHASNVIEQANENAKLSKEKSIQDYERFVAGAKSTLENSKKQAASIKESAEKVAEDLLKQANEHVSEIENEAKKKSLALIAETKEACDLKLSQADSSVSKARLELKADIKKEKDFIEEIKKEALLEAESIKISSKKEGEVANISIENARKRAKDILSSAEENAKISEQRAEKIILEAQQSASDLLAKSKAQANEFMSENKKRITTEKRELEKSLAMHKQRIENESDKLKNSIVTELEINQKNQKEIEIKHRRMMAESFRREIEENLPSKLAPYLRDEKDVLKVALLIERSSNAIILGDDVKDVDPSTSIQELIPNKQQKRVKKFWIAAGMLLLAFILILSLKPRLQKKMESSSRNIASVMQTEEDEKIKKVKKENDLSKEFSPKLEEKYFSSYTMRVLYTKNYNLIELNKEFRERWILSLQDYFVDSLQLDEINLVPFISQEVSLINELVEERSKINGNFLDEGIDRMNEIEEVFIMKIRENIIQDGHLEKIMAFKEAFFMKNYQEFLELVDEE